MLQLIWTATGDICHLKLAAQLKWGTSCLFCTLWMFQTGCQIHVQKIFHTHMQWNIYRLTIKLHLFPIYPFTFFSHSLLLFSFAVLSLATGRWWFGLKYIKFTTWNLHNEKLCFRAVPSFNTWRSWKPARLLLWLLRHGTHTKGHPVCSYQWLETLTKWPYVAPRLLQCGNLPSLHRAGSCCYFDKTYFVNTSCIQAHEKASIMSWNVLAGGISPVLQSIFTSVAE